MDSLPDTTIYAGDYELFYPELVELFERMSNSGVHVRIVEQRGGLHVFPLIPSKEGIKARKELLSDLEI
jgi:acetyl esterase/lipase